MLLLRLCVKAVDYGVRVCGLSRVVCAVQFMLGLGSSRKARCSGGCLNLPRPATAAARVAGGSSNRVALF